MVDISAVREADPWNDVTSDSTDTTWCLLGYPDGETGRIVPVEKGSGNGRQEVASRLSEDQVLYGAFRLTAVDDRGNTVSRRSKFIYFQFIGESVPAMRKARCSVHGGTVEGYFNGAHICLQISDPADLSEEDIVARLRASGGAHQPTHYEF